MSYKMRWTLKMTALGLATAGVVYVVTRSIMWAVVALVAAGAIANMVVQPGNRR